MGQQKAVVGKTGVQLQRQTQKKRYRSPEVLDVGDAVRRVLEHHFRGMDWIDQVVDGAEAYVSQCIQQFSTPTPVNSGPIQSGCDYKAFARTAEEIKETMAAEDGTVSRAPRQVPRYRERPDEVDIPERDLADPRINDASRDPLAGKIPPGHRVIIIPEKQDWVM